MELAMRGAEVPRVTLGISLSHSGPEPVELPNADLCFVCGNDRYDRNP